MHREPNCVFCKIIDGELSSFKIDENEKFIAILDIAQFVEGHTLVIPKEHTGFIWEMPDVGEYFQFVHSLGKHFRNLGYKYVDTLTLGRMVNHAHVHLLPHNDDDGNWNKVQTEIDQLQVTKEKPTVEQLEEIQKMFKKF